MNFTRTQVNFENLGYRFTIYEDYYLFCKVEKNEKGKYFAKVMLAIDKKATLGVHTLFVNMFPSKYGGGYRGGKKSDDMNGGSVSVELKIDASGYVMTLKTDEKMDSFIKKYVEEYNEIKNDEDLFP